MNDSLTLAGQLIESHDGDLRAALADVLKDENGLVPTSNALDVIMAVVREIDRTDTAACGEQPTVYRYAIDAERALRVLRRNR